LGLYRFLRPPDAGEKEMNAIYLLTGLITLALFIYLIIALLKPEWFE
jgi:K+-transporting ATPase KdpF subunit